MALVSVLLPAPGAPVSPTVYACPLSRVGEAADSTCRLTTALDERQQPGECTAVALAGGGEQFIRIGGASHASTGCQTGLSIAASASATLTTSVTPSTRSRMIRSMPPLRVWVDTGHVPQAPTSRTRHDAGGLVDVDELDVTVVRLERRADHFDAGFDFASHGNDHSISVSTRSPAPGP